MTFFYILKFSLIKYLQIKKNIANFVAKFIHRLFFYTILSINFIQLSLIFLLNNLITNKNMCV